MSRMERRQKTALDEAYRYYNRLENGETPDPFSLTKSVRTLRSALSFTDFSEFKLTRQLWKRLHQALFDRLLTTFPGQISLLNEKHELLEPLTLWPESGFLMFRSANCRRTDDFNEIELERLYPKTAMAIQNVWQNRGAFIEPRDFNLSDCTSNACYIKPFVTGHEIMGEESRKGKDEAYHRWWDLYWQAYCCPDRNQQKVLIQQMYALETVWGNLYY